MPTKITDVTVIGPSQLDGTEEVLLNRKSDGDLLLIPFSDIGGGSLTVSESGTIIDNNVNDIDFTGQVSVIQTASGSVQVEILGSSDNIYTTDGTIDLSSSDRVVSLTDSDTNALIFSGVDTVAGTTSSHSFTGKSGSFSITDSVLNQTSYFSVSIDSMEVADAINGIGLVYADDYSLNFTSRSLVDKAYVDFAVNNSGIQTINSELPVNGDIQFLEGSNIQITPNGDGTITLSSNSTGSTWGSITGTLSDQTDLQAALDAKINTDDFGTLFDADFLNKTTDDLSEGANNLYYTDQRASLAAPVQTLIEGSDISIIDDGLGNFTISSTGSGGGGTWGSITGTLSDQTDLQAALDAKISIYDSDGTITSTTRNVILEQSSNLNIDAYDSDSSTYNSRSVYEITSSRIDLGVAIGDATGSDSETTQLRVETDRITITSDSATFTGLNYGDDYSSGFTDRTLVDKAYVDNAVSGSASFYDQDGTIDGDRRVLIDNFGELEFFSFNGTVGSNSGLGFFTMDYESFQLGWQDTTSGITRSSFDYVDGVGFQLQDDALQVGLRYHADYSANYGDRSLVDKAYVVNYFAANSNFIQLPIEGNQGDFRSVAILNQDGDDLEYTSDLKYNDFTKQVLFENGDTSTGSFELVWRTDSQIDKLSINYSGVTGHFKTLGGNDLRINDYIFPETSDVMTFPSSDGTANQILSTDGSGNLDWIDSIPDSASVDLRWLFLAGTAPTDPTANFFKFNNADPSLITEIYVSELSYPNRNVANILGILKDGDRIYLQQNDSDLIYVNCDIDGDPVDNGTFWTITVNVFDSGAAFVPNSFCNFLIYHVGSGGSSSAAWGNITGTLSDQTDLQAALDAKLGAPVEGAQGNQRRIAIINTDGDDYSLTSDIFINEVSSQSIWRHGDTTSQAHEIVFRDSGDQDQFIINKDFTPAYLQSLSGNDLRLNNWIVPETGVAIFTLPNLDGNDGGSLTTDASGNLSFQDLVLFPNKTVGEISITIGEGSNSFAQGQNNIAIGEGTLSSLNSVTGSTNNAIGSFSQENNETGGENNSLGFNSLRGLVTGSENTAIGHSALEGDLVSGFNGSNNTALGAQAFGTIANTGSELTSADNCVAVGFNSRPSADGVSNEVVIGANAIGNGSNTVTLGSDTNTSTFLTGQVDIDGEYTLPTTQGTAGQILTADGVGGSSFEDISNGYTIFPIWAEDNSDLTNVGLEWSFGNGAKANNQIPIPMDCELFAVTFHCATGTGTASIDIRKRVNGANVTVVTTDVFSGNEAITQVFSNPFPFSATEPLAFLTREVTGTYNNARVCAWFRVKATSQSTSLLGELLDVSVPTPSVGDQLTYNGSNWATFSPSPARIVGGTADRDIEETEEPVQVTAFSVIDGGGEYNIDFSTGEITFPNADGNRVYEVDCSIAAFSDATSGSQRTTVRIVPVLDSIGQGSSEGRGYCREAGSAEQTGFKVRSTIFVQPASPSSVLVFNISKDLNTVVKYDRSQILIKRIQ